MLHQATRRSWPTVLLIFAAGCGGSPSTRVIGLDEVALQVAFVQFQAVLKSGNADNLWGMTDADTHTAAERAAERERVAAERLTPEERETKAKELGLSTEELTTLTGKTYLKTTLFLKRKPADEIPGSQFESASIQAGKAIVKYKETHGAENKLTFTKEGDIWKAYLPVE
jgi:hypothetical protein